MKREAEIALAANVSNDARTTIHHSPVIKRLGLVGYAQTYESMRRFTDERGKATADELWLLEHPPVYTVGPAGRPEHFPRNSTIPLVRIDRGGQVTYHGPGQAVVYVLVDLARRDLKVRAMVTLIEQAVINLLAEYDISAVRRSGAPGVYVGGAKIAALGLRVRRGCCYHGFALNVNMDLAPFGAIDPCGYPGLEVTQTAALGVAASVAELGDALARWIAKLLDRDYDRRH
jgi:lipoyl(octanoyl) transferase